jgi:hypothetical protein
MFHSHVQCETVFKTIASNHTYPSPKSLHIFRRGKIWGVQCSLQGSVEGSPINVFKVKPLMNSIDYTLVRLVWFNVDRSDTGNSCMLAITMICTAIRNIRPVQKSKMQHGLLTCCSVRSVTDCWKNSDAGSSTANPLLLSPKWIRV